MAVHISEDFIPADDPLFSPEFSADEHHFSTATIDMVRDIMAEFATNATFTIAESNDPRLVVDLMEWWNGLPATHQAMPWFDTDQTTQRFTSGMFYRCHVCHHNLKGAEEGPFCTCTATERDEQVAAIVRRDLLRLRGIVDNHKKLYDSGDRIAEPLKALERASSPGWTKAMNSVLCVNLGWRFLNSDYAKKLQYVHAYAKAAKNQMKVLSFLWTKQPFGGDGRGLPVLARWKALDVSDANKRWVQSLLRRYLGSDMSRAMSDWLATTRIAPRGVHLNFHRDSAYLHEAFRCIERYERGIQCTLLALGVRKAFEHEHRDASNEMSLIVSKVMPFLGPPTNHYTEAYLLQWWGISRQHHGALFYINYSPPRFITRRDDDDAPRRLPESFSEF